MTALDDIVERSADPRVVRTALERIGPERRERLVATPSSAAAAVAVIAASRSLTRLLERDDRALDVLADLALRAPVDRDDLAGWKSRELLRIAARDVTGVDDLGTTVRLLSDLARDVLVAAVDVAGAHELAIVAMGKLGAGELNYASDIDIVFVGGEQRAARRVLDVARSCFRVDVNLRPEGRDGALTRSTESYVAYWERWGEPWERQALLKARAIAGDPSVGEGFAKAAAAAVWDARLSADDLRALRRLKARAEEQLARQGDAEREVKRGPGGIRDVEFAVQLLQLVHGPDDVELRAPATLSAIQQLVAGGYVDARDGDVLTVAYTLLRRVEHALQLEDEQQVHTVPADRDGRRRLARVLGYRGAPEAGPTEQLDADLARHRNLVRSTHEQLWFRPLLDALVEGGGALTTDAAEARLAAFGFTDAERTRQAVSELTRGLRRSSRLMQQLLPLVLDWLSASPDPDLGLLTLRKLVDDGHRAMELATALRDAPQAARACCVLVGTSPLLGEVLVANPDLIDRAGDPDRLKTRSRDELVTSADGAVRWRARRDDQQQALRRWYRRNLFGVAARDVLGHADVAEVGADLSALAEAAVEVALGAVAPGVPMAVIAAGRFGGAELSYASDLDLLFVYEGYGARDQEEALRAAGDVVRFLGGGTPATRILTVDLDLRPEGRQGPIARSLESHRAYFERWAVTWERQAMLRARVVAGDRDVGSQYCTLAEELVWGRPFTDEDAREIRRMKARIERERIPHGEDPDFHLKLGRGSLSDVEFTVQLLQLRAGVREPSTIGALRALRAIGALDLEDADMLERAYRFCERTRNRLHLVGGPPSDALPHNPEQLARLARALQTTAPELRDEYRQVTRRARRVVERAFYGRP